MRARQRRRADHACSRSRPRPAFVLFARHPADVLLLEVGLGGRLDATNVIERPLASVVTPVSMDHVEFLGDTLEKIAAEKAGIFKRGVPAVIAPQADRGARRCSSATPRRRARRCMSRASTGSAHEEHGRLVYQDEDGPARPAAAEAVRPPPVRQCRHRHRGAARGRASALPVDGHRAGARRAPNGRRACSASRTGKLVALAPAGSELWLDGGHNADGGRAIAAALGDLEERVSRPLVLIVGMLATKDRAGFLRNFTGLVRRVFARADPPGQERAGRRDRGGRARRRHAGRMPATSIEDALAAIGRLGFDPPPRILITGSLYLAGEVLAANGTEPP